MLRTASLLLCIVAVLHGAHARRGATSQASSTTTITTDSSNRAGNDEEDMLLDDTEELLETDRFTRRRKAAMNTGNAQQAQQAQAKQTTSIVQLAKENAMFCNAEKDDPTKWIKMEDDLICLNQTANTKTNEMGPDFCVDMSSLENASTTSDATWRDPNFVQCPENSALRSMNRTIPPIAEPMGYGNAWCIVSYERVVNRSLTWSIMGGVEDRTVRTSAHCA